MTFDIRFVVREPGETRETTASGQFVSRLTPMRQSLVVRFCPLDQIIQIRLIRVQGFAWMDAVSRTEFSRLYQLGKVPAVASAI